MNYTILIADDEPEIRTLLRLYLENENYQIIEAENGKQALELLKKEHVDLCLLDIMMPEMDGFTLCKKIREKSSSIGIIMLSAKTQEMDKVNGLMLGADDYVTKPFSPSELVARVDAIHRRVTMASQQQQTFEITSGPFVINQKSRTLTKNGKLIDLTQVEFQIMEYLLKNPNVALERSDILSHVWGENYFGDIKIVDVNIRRLRMKIEEDPSSPQYLTTVWGFGYKWTV